MSNLNKKEKYFYSDNFLGSEKFWVPTMINKVCLINKMKFIIPKDMQCLCSGEMEEEKIEEEGNWK